MNVHWAEQHARDVPDDDRWLSAREAAHLSRLRIPKRHTDWRLGRWTAKCGIAACLEVSPEFAAIEVRAASSGAPEVFIAGAPAVFTISLSHREDEAICAITPGDAALGCDLELVEPRDDAFVGEYFTDAEEAAIGGVRDESRLELITLFWSAKESALKALKSGLRRNTRSLQVAPTFVPEHHGWCWLRVETGEQRGFEGWWRRSGNFVQSVVAEPAPAPPIELKVSAPSLHKVRIVTEPCALVV
jgi:4'-phosphopantetheinyl transferase